jgi:glutamate synthase domain-containing protein 2
MVAVGAYYAGTHIVHLDGAYGGTGAAPEIAKKNIAMPIEYAIPKVHKFLVEEGIRDQITLMVSGGLRSVWDVAKAIALGADGAILGTAELVAIGCVRIASCEKGLGCPFGITTTDPEQAKLVNAMEAYQRIVNMYNAWMWQLAGILQTLGMKSVGELRGRSDLLVYLD